MLTEKKYAWSKKTLRVRYDVSVHYGGERMNGFSFNTELFFVGG